MGEHIYLTESNAEELLEKAIHLIKTKEHFESRNRAFDDCTKYWTVKVAEIVEDDDLPNIVRVHRIRKLFNLE